MRYRVARPAVSQLVQLNHSERSIDVRAAMSIAAGD
jgi:hypothetical protein